MPPARRLTQRSPQQHGHTDLGYRYDARQLRLPFLFDTTTLALADARREDIYDIFKELDPKYAIQCVQHNHVPKETEKMDGQVQTVYNRKNWSSFFAINADHPSNGKLTLEMVNTIPGRDLHAFCWLADDEIGALTPGWNWLVNVQERPQHLHNAHLTLGGPWFPDWKAQPHDDLWMQYHDWMLAEQAAQSRKQA